MADFNGFRDQYYEGTGMNPGYAVLPPRNHKLMNIPTINVKAEEVEQFLSQSLDIKKQLSASLGGPAASYGGINKPQSRKASIISVRLQDDDDDGDPGNERKRRDNINDKIQELLTLIPAEYFDPLTQKGENHDEEDLAVRNLGTKDGKPNKGQILTKLVDYLRDLQNQIDENNRKEVELQIRLRSLEQGSSEQSSRYTSAEQALGEIGVGPLLEGYFKLMLSGGMRRKS